MKRVGAYLLPLLTFLAGFGLCLYLSLQENQEAVAEIELRGTRIGHCQDLAFELDEMLGEESNAYDGFVNSFSDYLNGDVSYAKAESDIAIITSDRERRAYEYDLLIERYRGLCFDL